MGAVKDGYNSMVRYYYNNFNDGYRQVIIMAWPEHAFFNYKYCTYVWVNHSLGYSMLSVMVCVCSRHKLEFQIHALCLWMYVYVHASVTIVDDCYTIALKKLCLVLKKRERCR